MVARPMDCSAGCAEIAGPFDIQYEFSLATMRVKIAKRSAMQDRRRHDSRVLSSSARDSPVSTSANLYACHWCSMSADLHCHHARSTFADLNSHYASSTSADLYSDYACSTSPGLYSHCSTSAGLHSHHSCSRSADYRRGESCCSQS